MTVLLLNNIIIVIINIHLLKWQLTTSIGVSVPIGGCLPLNLVCYLGQPIPALFGGQLPPLFLQCTLPFMLFLGWIANTNQ